MATIKILNYEIDYSPQARLGKGSYGDVYKAKNTLSNEIVAVKILDVKKLHMKHYTFKRIQDEIDSMKVTVEQYTNGNPNIIRFYDVAEKDDQVFIFEEFCQGGSLQSMIYHGGPLQDKYCKKFLRQIIEGVRFLHSNNIVHRDLKPDNLMMTTSNPETAVVKIIDFGLSRKLNDSNLGGTMCGSPGYIAPEVLFPKRNKKYGLKVDLWSVGAILYTMITGRKIHLNDVKKDLESLPPYITKECKEVLYGLLKKNPEDRMSCEQILNHSYLLPPRPSFFDGGEEDFIANNTGHGEEGGKMSPNLTVSTGHINNGDSNIGDQSNNNNNLLNYLPSMNNKLSPINSCGSNDYDDASKMVKSADMIGNSNDASQKVFVNDIQMKMGDTSESAQKKESEHDKDNDDDLNDSFVDEWSMIDLSEEEKAHIFLKPTKKKSSSFIETSSSIIKDTMRKVLKKASGTDTGLSSSSSSSSSGSDSSIKKNAKESNSNNSSVFICQNSSRSSRIHENEAKSSTTNSSNIMTPSTSSGGNLQAGNDHSNINNDKTVHDKPNENNSKSIIENNGNCNDVDDNDNDVENSSSSSNTSINVATISHTEKCKTNCNNNNNDSGYINGEVEEVRASSLLYAPETIAKRLSNMSSDKPESPMMVVNSNASQAITRRASNDNYRNGVWSMSYKGFEVGDAAIFIKNLQYDNVYTMFQHGAKHPIFLNEDCIDVFKKYYLTPTTTTLPNVISGRIILIEDDQKATRHDNPYHLPHSGDVFGTVTVERLSESLIRKIEPAPERNFSTDYIACGTTNLFVIRSNDGVQKGVYIMLRHTDKNGSDGVPYFLDLECVATINRQMRYVQNYILGEVICIEERIASGNDRWGVAAGERYGLCTITPL